MWFWRRDAKWLTDTTSRLRINFMHFVRATHEDLEYPVPWSRFELDTHLLTISALWSRPAQHTAPRNFSWLACYFGPRLCNALLIYTRATTQSCEKVMSVCLGLTRPQSKATLQVTSWSHQSSVISRKTAIYSTGLQDLVRFLAGVGFFIAAPRWASRPMEPPRSSGGS
jgi:hypothetical protein